MSSSNRRSVWKLGLIGVALSAGAIAATGAAVTNASPQEIVVTATRTETPAYRVPADVTVIPEETLRQPGNANYQQALGAVPGVRLNTRQDNEMGVPGIEVRGLGSNPLSGGNVLILLDGIPQRRLSFGGPYVGAMPSDAVTRMELVKGPAASLYGRGALSGALQLFTSPGTTDWEVGTWNSWEDTVDQFRSAWRVTGPLGAGADSTFSLTGSGTTSEGWQPRTSGDRADAYLHALVPVGANDTLRLLAGYVDSYQEKSAPVLIDRSGRRLPGIARDENLSVPDQNDGDFTESRAGVIWERAMTDRLRSKLTLSYWNADTYWKVGRPSDSPATGTVIDRSASNRSWEEDAWFSEFQIVADYELGAAVSGSLVAGGSAERWTYNNRYQSIWSPGSTAVRGILLDLATRLEPDPSTWIYGPWSELDTTDKNYGGFVRNRFSFGRRVELDGGVRYDGYERKQEDRVSGAVSTVNEDAVSPSAGLAYHVRADDPEALTLYTAWGRGFWPVYRNVGPGEIAEIPPETSTSYEAGIKNSLFARRLTLNAAVYRQERNDVVGTDPATGKPGDIGDWTVRGVELGVSARLAGAWVVYANGTRRSPEIAKDAAAPATEGNDIPMVARSLSTLGVAWQPRLGWFGGLENTTIGKSFADTANTIRIGSYSLLSAQAGYRWKNVTAAVFGRNLLDDEYYSDVFLGVVNGSAFEGTPRSIGVSLAATF